MDGDFEVQQSSIKAEPKKGRRAKLLFKQSKESPNENISSAKKVDGPIRPSRRQMGWDKNSNPSSGELIDSRLIQGNNPQVNDDDDSETPSIPDLAEIHEDTIFQEVAAPPSVFTSTIASYKQLSSDLVDRSAFRTLDGDIDLKALIKNLSSEQEVAEEEDAAWQWERLFAELSGSLMTPQGNSAAPIS